MKPSDMPYEQKEPFRLFLEGYGCKPKDVKDVRPIGKAFNTGYRVIFKKEAKYVSITGKLDLK